MVRPVSWLPTSADFPARVRQSSGKPMSLSVMVSPQHRVDTTCASKTLTAPSARSVSTGLALANVSNCHPLAWSGTTVQKTPMLSSGQVVRRYASWGGLGESVRHQGTALGSLTCLFPRRSVLWLWERRILQCHDRIQVRDGQGSDVGPEGAWEGLLQTSFRAVLGRPPLLVKHLLFGRKVTVDVAGLVQGMIDRLESEGALLGGAGLSALASIRHA